MFTFDSSDDWGPYEQLFNNLAGYNVQITTTDRPKQDYTVKRAQHGHVILTTWLPSDTVDGTGPDVRIAWESLEVLVVY